MRSPLSVAILGATLFGAIGGLVVDWDHAPNWSFLGAIIFFAGTIFVRRLKKKKGASPELTPEIRAVFDRMTGKSPVGGLGPCPTCGGVRTEKDGHICRSCVGVLRKNAKGQSRSASDPTIEQPRLTIEGTILDLMNEDLDAARRGERIETRLAPENRLKLNILIKSFQKDRAMLVEQIKSSSISGEEKKKEIKKIEDELSELIFTLKRESSAEINALFETIRNVKPQEFAQIERELLESLPKNPLNKSSLSEAEAVEKFVLDLYKKRLSVPARGPVVLLIGSKVSAKRVDRLLNGELIAAADAVLSCFEFSAPWVQARLLEAIESGRNVFVYHVYRPVDDEGLEQFEFGSATLTDRTVLERLELFARLFNEFKTSSAVRFFGVIDWLGRVENVPPEKIFSFFEQHKSSGKDILKKALDDLMEFSTKTKA